MGDVGGIEAEQKEVELLKKVARGDAKIAPAFARTVAGEVEETMIISSFYRDVMLVCF
ncbi:TPA: hypothetical protein OMT15_004310 [Enterobacter cancerogenus]|nr:hypothetical protein [Enterobacter cancerogenus]